MVSRWDFLCVLVAGFTLMTGCRATGPQEVSVVHTAGDLPLPASGEWLPLLDGDSLENWQVIQFGGEGEVEVRDGGIVLRRGQPFTGIRLTNATPTLNYEVELEARRLSGYDFFCGLTVPVGSSHCSLIVGGWGGGVVGISSLDGYDAANNETATLQSFEDDRWYRIRLRVTERRIQAWLDDERVVNVLMEGRRVGLRRGMIEMCRPLGVCSWETTAEVRNIRIRAVRP